MSDARPATGGRKSKLTPELIAQVETALKAHNTVEATCEMLAISKETFYKWIREGEAARSGMKADFSDAVKRAQGMSQVVLVNAISKDPSWQAKAWLLERMYPKRYGRRQLIAHAGADGETDLPAGNAAPVKLVMNFLGADKQETPWIHKEGTDPEPHNGSDPWESESVKWDGPPPEADQPQPIPPEPAPPPDPPGWPNGKLDTGGRSRDPDEP